MKITINVDVTPEEARSFLGLPNVEKLQEQWLENAQEYLQNSGQSQMSEFIGSAMQPVFAYQNWVQRMLMGGEGSSAKENSEEQDETKSGK